MEKLNLQRLRQQRMKQYWGGITPYFRYVGGSALGFLFIMALFLAGYDYFVSHLPERFPSYVVMAVLLTIPTNSSSFRTYLRHADIVFLLPKEPHMRQYLMPCLRSAYGTHILMLTVMWFFLLPLFHAVNGQVTQSLIVTIWIQLVIIQAVVMYGSWQEHQFQESRTRRLFSLVRLLTVGLLIYAVLTQSFAWSLLSISVTSIVYLLALRAVAQYTINWDRLFILEQKSQSRWITFLNLFIEVPREQSSVHQTRFMHRLARALTFKKSNAYRYLYLLTWIRSELFGIITRLTVLAIVLIIVMDPIWVKLGLLALFAYVIKLQLSELKLYHRNVEVSSVYPVYLDQRTKAAKFIAARIHIGILVMLVGSLLISSFL